MLPRFLYPGPTLMAEALLLALVLDILYPYHSGIMLTIHPVHTAFVMSQRLYRPYSSRARGVGIWALVVLSHLAAYGLLLYAAWLVSPYAWLVAAAYELKVSASLRLLLDTVARGARALSEGRLSEAREEVQGIVRRDLSAEDPGHVASAAIESLAESLVDGFSSPLLWYALLGPLGALLQRVANTLDGSLGFMDSPHRDVGWMSAWADTVINYVPARLTALIIALASPAGGGNPRASLRAWITCRKLTKSKNAGSPMSSMAGALGVRLEKRNEYTLCSDLALPTADDVRRSIRIAVMAALLTVAIVILLVLSLGSLI